MPTTTIKSSLIMRVASGIDVSRLLRPTSAGVLVQVVLVTMRALLPVMLNAIVRFTRVTISPVCQVTSLVQRATAFATSKLRRLLSRGPRLQTFIRGGMEISNKLPVFWLASAVLKAAVFVCSLGLAPAFAITDAIEPLAFRTIRAATDASPLLLPAFAAATELYAPHSLTLRHAVDATSNAGRFLRRQSLQSPLLGGAALTMATVASARGSIRRNEGLQRSLKFNKKMAPMAIEYRFYQWLLAHADPAERKRVFKRLHQRHAPEVLAAIYELRGFYIKVGPLPSRCSLRT